MKRFFYSEDNHGLWLSILMILIGLILVIWPGHVMETAMTILGVALVIGGGLLIFSWYRGRPRSSSVVTLAEGIVMALMGLAVLLAPRFLINLIPTIVGILVLLNGILNLAQALDQRRETYNRWTSSLVLAILTILLGLIILFNPFSTMEMLVIAIGVVIIYNGISNLIIEAGYRKLYRR